MPSTNACEKRDALLSRLSRQRWPVTPLLDTLHLPCSAGLLDVGAGQGRLLGELRQRGHSGPLAGVDPEPGQGVAQGRAEDLPFPADSFDVVLMLRVLGHVHDKRQALAEARRVLRPGGQLILASSGADHLQETWLALGQLIVKTGPEVVLRDALEQAGLAAERLDIRVPVMLKKRDVKRLAESYQLEYLPNAWAFPLQDILHLVVYRHEKRA